MFKILTNSIVLGGAKTEPNFLEFSPWMKDLFRESLIENWREDPSLIGSWPEWFVQEFRSIVESNPTLKGEVEVFCDQKIRSITTGDAVNKLLEWRLPGIQFLNLIVKDRYKTEPKVLGWWTATYGKKISGVPPPDFIIDTEWDRLFVGALSRTFLSEFEHSNTIPIRWTQSMIDLVDPVIKDKYKGNDDIISIWGNIQNLQKYFRQIVDNPSGKQIDLTDIPPNQVQNLKIELFFYCLNYEVSIVEWSDWAVEFAGSILDERGKDISEDNKQIWKNKVEQRKNYQKGQQK